MSNTQPKYFRSQHRAKFKEIDPYGHMNTEHYLSYFIEHRFQGLRDVIGWDLKTLAKLEYAIVIQNIQLEFLSPVLLDQEFVIQSHAHDFEGSRCQVSCTMQSPSEKPLAKSQMTVVCVDKKTQKPMDWPQEAIRKFYQD